MALFIFLRLDMELIFWFGSTFGFPTSWNTHERRSMNEMNPPKMQISRTGSAFPNCVCFSFFFGLGLGRALLLEVVVVAVSFEKVNAAAGLGADGGVVVFAVFIVVVSSLLAILLDEKLYFFRSIRC